MNICYSKCHGTLPSEAYKRSVWRRCCVSWGLVANWEICIECNTVRNGTQFHFQSSSWLVETLGGHRRWLKYLSLCHQCRSPTWSLWLQDLSVPALAIMCIWEVNHRTENLALCHFLSLSL